MRRYTVSSFSVTVITRTGRLVLADSFARSSSARSSKRYVPTAIPKDPWDAAPGAAPFAEDEDVLVEGGELEEAEVAAGAPPAAPEADWPPTEAPPAVPPEAVAPPAAAPPVPPAAAPPAATPPAAAPPAAPLRESLGTVPGVSPACVPAGAGVVLEALGADWTLLDE